MVSRPGSTDTKMIRIARSAVPLIAAILIAWPFGFPPGILFIGAVLSYLVYQYWEGAYSNGERVYRFLRDLPKTLVSEVKQPPPPETRHSAPTEPITGHLVPDPAPSPTPPPSPVVLPNPQPTEDEEPAFVIGSTEDGRTIELDEISSLGVGGVPGSGKTVSMLGLATQAVVKYKGNVRFLLVDPHMNSGSGDALSARMAPLAPFYLRVPGIPNPVSGGGAWIKWLKQQAKDRIGGKVPKDQQFKIVLMADEFTALLDDPEISEPLTELLLLINEQARKVGIFALVASPAWKSSRIQGTDIRNTIASFLVHNMPPAIARQLLPYEEAERANRLAKGQAIFSSFGLVETVRVQLMTERDIARCIQPYLPTTKPETVLEEATAIVPEPSIAEVRSIWETYMILNQELHYEEDSAIRALAIDVYGPGDPHGIEKVKKALKLGEEHL